MLKSGAYHYNNQNHPIKWELHNTKECPILNFDAPFSRLREKGRG